MPLKVSPTQKAGQQDGWQEQQQKGLLVGPHTSSEPISWDPVDQATVQSSLLNIYSFRAAICRKIQVSPSY